MYLTRCKVQLLQTASKSSNSCNSDRLGTGRQQSIAIHASLIHPQLCAWWQILSTEAMHILSCHLFPRRSSKPSFWLYWWRPYHRVVRVHVRVVFIQCLHLSMSSGDPGYDFLKCVQIRKKRRCASIVPRTRFSLTELSGSCTDGSRLKIVVRKHHCMCIVNQHHGEAEDDG